MYLVWWKTIKNQSDLIRIIPRDQSEWIRTNLKPSFQSSSIRTIRSRIDRNRLFNQNQSESFRPWIHYDWFWLIIRSGSIRDRIVSDWSGLKTWFRIHLDWPLGINRIKWDWFLTVFYQTWYKTFLGLVRHESHWLGYRYQNESE